MNELDRDAVRQEFDLFCRVGLDEAIRAAVLATSLTELGLEDESVGCPIELRSRMVDLALQVTNAADELEQIVHMSMELGQFVRLFRFLQRFDAEQIKALQGA